MSHIFFFSQVGTYNTEMFNIIFFFFINVLVFQEKVHFVFRKLQINTRHTVSTKFSFPPHFAPSSYYLMSFLLVERFFLLVVFFIFSFYDAVCIA